MDNSSNKRERNGMKIVFFDTDRREMLSGVARGVKPIFSVVDNRLKCQYIKGIIRSIN